MRYLIALVLLASASLSAGLAHAQNEVRPMSWAEAEAIIQENQSELLVVNFWATWCVPCVRELPAFQQVADEYASKGLKLLLVSLDFPSDLDSRVLPFVEKKGLGSYDIFLITDTDANSWLGKVDESWSGAIPATLLVNKQGQYVGFHEAMMTYEELKAFIEPHL